MKINNWTLKSLIAGICLFVNLPAFCQGAVTPCFPAPSGIVAWWQAESNTLDYVGLNDGVWVGSPSYASGEVQLAFNLTGTNYVQITNSAAMNQFTNAMTIELWMKSGTTNNNTDWRSFIAKGNNAWRLMGTTFAKTTYVAFSGASPSDLTGTIEVNDGQWHHIAATYDGSVMALYVDGQLDVSQSATGSINQNTQPVDIGSDSNAPGDYRFKGEIDEVSLYNRALTPCEIQSIYLVGPTGKCR